VALVHHVITRAQLQRVHHVAPAAGDLDLGARRRGCAAGEVRLVEHEDALLLERETHAGDAWNDVDDAPLAFDLYRLDHPARHARVPALLRDALSGSGARRGDDDAPAERRGDASVVERRSWPALEGLDVADACGLRGVAAKGADRLPVEPRHLDRFLQLWEGEEAAPRERAVRRGIGDGAEVDGSVRARRGAHPCGRQELLGRVLEVLGPPLEALGLERHHCRPPWHELHERREPVDEHGQQTLHSLDGVSSGDARQQVRRGGEHRDQG